MLSKMVGRFPRLKVIWADGAYAGKLVAWVWVTGGWLLSVVRRRPDSHSFEVLPRRWVAERTLAWPGRCRRLSKDYEALPETSEASVYVAMIHLMLKGLQPAWTGFLTHPPSRGHSGAPVPGLRSGGNTRTGPDKRAHVHAGRAANSATDVPGSGPGYRRTGNSHSGAGPIPSSIAANLRRNADNPAWTDAGSPASPCRAVRSYDSDQGTPQVRFILRSGLRRSVPHLRATGGRDHHLLGHPRGGRAPDRLRRAH